MAVISASGAVGRIIETASNASTVLLLTDARSDIDVYVERTRIKAVIEGSGEDSLILKYIRIDDTCARRRRHYIRAYRHLSEGRRNRRGGKD